MRVLITGWPSFLHGEATAGDVLSMRHVSAALSAQGIPNDMAWSPNFAPGERGLEAARPQDYTHLVFACGPVHGWQIEELHVRYANCYRIAVGVSVLNPHDPAVAGFHRVLPRDGSGRPSVDLAAAVDANPVPVAGVALAPAQPEYGPRRRHDAVHRVLGEWLNGLDCAALELDTRLAPGHWRSCSTVDQFIALVGRIDVMVTTRLHGLVFALSCGKPALVVDPVHGGGKVTAQADAWHWPAVAQADELTSDRAFDVLDELWARCLSMESRERAQRCGAARTGSPLLASIVDSILEATAREHA